MTTVQLISLLICLVLTAVCLRGLRSAAYRFDLIDEPCSRKRHQIATPLLGGISIFLGFLTAVLIGVDPGFEISGFLWAAALMVFLGVLDDKYDVSAGARLAGQVLIATLLIFAADIQFVSLGNLFGFGAIELGMFSIPFTYLAILAAINAFNMIDGIDGLLGGVALLSFTAIGILSALHGAQTLAYLSLLIAVALVPFLVSNLGYGGSGRKVFMGDSGSMFIGLAIVWLLVIATQQNQLVGSVKPVTALWLVALPIMDIVTVMWRRLLDGRSPLQAGRDHVHHFYMQAGFSPRKTLVLLLTYSVVLQTIGLMGDLLDFHDAVLLYGFIGVYFAYLLHLKWLQDKANKLKLMV